MEPESDIPPATSRGLKFNNLIDDCQTMLLEKARRFVTRSSEKRPQRPAAPATPARTTSERTPAQARPRARTQDDPLTFLLDSVSDAVNLWSADGELLYRNRASGSLHSVFVPTAPSLDRGDVENFALLGRHFERRYLRCHIERQDYFLEVIRDVR